MQIRVCKEKVALPPLLVTNLIYRDIFSPKILSAFGFSLEDHLPGRLFPSFEFFVSGNLPVKWLHFGLIQVVEPVIFTH